MATSRPTLSNPTTPSTGTPSHHLHPHQPQQTDFLAHAKPQLHVLSSSLLTSTTAALATALVGPTDTLSKAGRSFVASGDASIPRTHAALERIRAAVRDLDDRARLNTDNLGVCVQGTMDVLKAKTAVGLPDRHL
ncbi:hypothetical protein HKX48_006284 [Thoreauomyces humboldtii]|nr:hypothetical protein HKX48_006284 [Thoreauomyces humboldtii]